jgi:acyl carrier protein
VTTLDRVNEVLRKVFDDPGLVVGPATTASDVDGWDSLSHVNVVVAIEAHFGIRFSQREALGFKTVGDMVQQIEGKLAVRG